KPHTDLGRAMMLPALKLRFDCFELRYHPANTPNRYFSNLRKVLGQTARPPLTAFHRSHSSRRSIAGSTDSARCAGIHVAISPSNAIARTVPVNTRGSRGVA